MTVKETETLSVSGTNSDNGIDTDSHSDRESDKGRVSQSDCRNEMTDADRNNDSRNPVFEKG